MSTRHAGGGYAWLLVAGCQVAGGVHSVLRLVLASKQCRYDNTMIEGTWHLACTDTGQFDLPLVGI